VSRQDEEAFKVSEWVSLQDYSWKQAVYFEGLLLVSGEDAALVAANGWTSFIKKTLRDSIDSRFDHDLLGF
ncbi:hypothetical protein Tco_0875052, partial [Tanacetum coccineum]